MNLVSRAILACTLSLSVIGAAENEPAFTLDDSEKAACLEILRGTLSSPEFWPSMHAAEALTLAGYGDEVRKAVEPMLDTITDLQHRCGLARELVRAGDRSKASILIALLDGPDPYAHVHAAESSYKVWVLGDGEGMRKAFLDKENTPRAMMAAAALARWGNGEALSYIREQVKSDDIDTARIAAWVLGRIGDVQDIPALRAGLKKFDDVQAKGFFNHALAALGDAKGQANLAKNLSSENDTVRTMAATFAGELGLIRLKAPLLALLKDEYEDVRVRSAQSLLQMANATTPYPTDMVVTDVYPATDENPRYSEGDIHVLNDGKILFGTSEFIADWSDFAKARIVGRISADGGQTWGEKTVLQENIGEKNVMSLTFQDLSDTEVGMFYLHKNGVNDLDVYLRRSTDGGVNFGEASLVTDMAGYHVMNNDRVVKLSSGRLLVPVAWTEDVETVNHFSCRTWISDDKGVSWRAGKGTVDYAQRGAMEPECIELKDGRVLMIFRNQLGHIGAAYSEDGGDSWGDPVNWGVRSPEAPATLRRIPSTGDLLLIWNDTFVEGEGHGGKRSPLTLAISKDEGKTWLYKRNIEESADGDTAFIGGYSYISATFDHGRLLLSYYVAEAASKNISSRFRSMPIAWLYE